jgi:hypothetical protein
MFRDDTDKRILVLTGKSGCIRVLHLVPSYEDAPACQSKQPRRSIVNRQRMRASRIPISSKSASNIYDTTDDYIQIETVTKKQADASLTSSITSISSEHQTDSSSASSNQSLPLDSALPSSLSSSTDTVTHFDCKSRVQESTRIYDGRKYYYATCDCTKRYLRGARGVSL